MSSQLPVLLLAAFSFWVPQIWHNIAHTARQPLMPTYIFGNTAARLLLPVYLLCCPVNLLQLTPQPWLAGLLLAWVGMQVLVLLLQYYFHPHIILPPSWAPVRYNYHRVEVCHLHQDHYCAALFCVWEQAPVSVPVNEAGNRIPCVNILLDVCEALA